MISTPDKFNVTDFNIDGFLKLSESQKKEGGYQYFLQKNEVAFHTQWKVAVGVDLAIFEINASYEPINKLDFLKLASYKASQNFTFVGIKELDNEKTEIENVGKLFYKTLTDEYNSRLKNTKIDVPFPKTNQQDIDQFRERAISSLHKALERVKNLPKM